MTPSDDSGKKTEVIHVRLTKEEKEKVVRLAQDGRRSITQFIIWLIERYETGR